MHLKFSLQLLYTTNFIILKHVRERLTQNFYTFLLMLVILAFVDYPEYITLTLNVSNIVLFIVYLFRVIF